jgi:hypothetical protein
MRDNGVWFYGIINLTHILGVATLFGSMVILDLRLLGFWPDAPKGRGHRGRAMLPSTGLPAPSLHRAPTLGSSRRALPLAIVF